MTELLDAVDENGKPTGEVADRKTAHSEGIRHRTAHLWVVRPGSGGWEILLQKRALTKDTFPGKYDTSSAGHITAGDEPLPSALRELREELGISALPSDLGFIGTFPVSYDRKFFGKTVHEREVANLFCYRKPVDIDNLTLQKEEVDSVKWFSLSEVFERVRAKDDAFCVPLASLLLLETYLTNAGGTAGKE